jgi:3-hydroxyacyl-CoA dehydrogenase/3-hydroxy-2-methylbutyryl-CoA dehydrogenase
LPEFAQGLVTLVTGGASGLGKATIDRLHQRGAKIALMDTVQSRGEEVVKQLGSQAIYTPADVGNLAGEIKLCFV